MKGNDWRQSAQASPRSPQYPSKTITVQILYVRIRSLGLSISGFEISGVRTSRTSVFVFLTELWHWAFRNVPFQRCWKWQFFVNNIPAKISGVEVKVLLLLRYLTRMCHSHFSIESTYYQCKRCAGAKITYLRRWFREIDFVLLSTRLLSGLASWHSMYSLPLKTPVVTDTTFLYGWQ